MYVLSDRKFNLTSFGALAIVIGIITNNSLNKLNVGPSIIKKYLSLLPVIAGWIFITYSNGFVKGLKLRKGLNKFLSMGSSVGILVLYLVQKFVNVTGTPSTVMMVISGILWLLFGFSSGSSKRTRIMGVLGSISIILSERLLTWQQKNCLVNGPSASLLLLGWVFIIISSSLSDRKSNVRAAPRRRRRRSKPAPVSA